MEASTLTNIFLKKIIVWGCKDAPSKHIDIEFIETYAQKLFGCLYRAKKIFQMVKISG